MNSSWWGWMWTGTNWPGSLLVSKAKVEAQVALGSQANGDGDALGREQHGGA